MDRSDGRTAEADLPADMSVPWHTRVADEALRGLGVDAADGLDGRQVEQRRLRYGPNRLEEQRATPAWVTLLGQFRSPLIYILLAAGVLTVVLGEYIDAGVIAAVLALNAGIGFHQERRAEQSVRALMHLVSPTAHVRRDGHDATVDSSDLVPGDIVLVESGDRVPADLRLIETRSLRVDESLLTGESVPADKSLDPVGADAMLGDQQCMAFTGSIVSSGRGCGVVVATGAHSALGRIAEQMRSTTELESPLQQRMRRFAHLIGAIIGAAAALTFALGLFLGESVSEMLLVAAALAVAAIPEGLPVVLTVALALGVRAMARRKAIVRRLSAVETLGSTTLIGSDKTGTLTRNQMTIEAVHVAGRRIDDLDSVEDPTRGAFGLAVLAGILANESTAERGENGLEVDGDPTATAFLRAADQVGVDPISTRREWRTVAAVPFESERRFAASYCESSSGEAMVFVLGAPEKILEMCSSAATEDGTPGPLDAEALHRASLEMARDGLRVLATACRRVGADEHPELASADDAAEPGDLMLLGLHGELDPPREGVAESIADCMRAGIRVIMITGDHAETARAIASELGIIEQHDGDVVTGIEVASLDDGALAEVVSRTSVFARVAPEHKLRIVEAARDLGHVVAVTGDGVNDAPALKSADIGVAMGRSGTDVAREAADIVLVDDNFVSIHAAVEQGRVTFDNVRNVTFFLVSTGLGTFAVIPVAMAFGWPLILVPAQLLWANLITKGLQDLALAFEPGDPDVLEHPPRGRREPVITATLWWRTLLVGSVIAAGTLLMFGLAYGRDGINLAQAQAIALSTLVVFQAFHLGSCRSQNRSVFQVPLLSNRFLLYAQVGALTVQFLAPYLAPTRFLLRIEPFPLETWLVIVPVAASVLVVIEIDKAVRRWAHGRSGGVDRSRPALDAAPDAAPSVDQPRSSSGARN